MTVKIPTVDRYHFAIRKELEANGSFHEALRSFIHDKVDLGTLYSNEKEIDITELQDLLQDSFTEWLWSALEYLDTKDLEKVVNMKFVGQAPLE